MLVLHLESTAGGYEMWLRALRFGAMSILRRVIGRPVIRANMRPASLRAFTAKYYDASDAGNDREVQRMIDQTKQSGGKS